MHKCQFRLNLIAAATAAVFAPTLYAQSAGRVDFATPGVNVIGANGQSRPAGRGSELAAGETIDTGAGRAQLRFTDGALVSLQPQTQFRLESYSYDKDDSSKNSVVMNMLKGGLRTITGLIGKTNRQGYKLQTPTATVGIRGTEISITGFPDGSVLIHVADGAVDVSNRGGTSVINAGQSALVMTPDSAPTKTDEKPFLPPLAYNGETKLAQPVNPVQDAQPIIASSAPKLTGTFQGQYVTTQASNPYGPDRPYYTPTFTLDANGNLQAYGQKDDGSGGGITTFAAITQPQGPYSETHELGQAGVRLYGNDGIMAWGTWEGGPSTHTAGYGSSTSTGNVTYNAGDPLHWVVGQPLVTMPTSGSATYQAYGGTAPSCIGPSCGQITVSSSFWVDFGTYSGRFSLKMKNAGDGVSLTTPNGGLALSVNSGNGQLYSSGSMDNAADATTLASGDTTFYGFLANKTGDYAGGAYNVNYTAANAQAATRVAGGLVYKVDASTVGPGSVSGSWATTTNNYSSPATGVTDNYNSSFYALDNAGALKYFGTDSYEGYNELRNTATAVVEGSSDGVLTWGHWSNGTSTSSYYYSGYPTTNDYTFNPMHYVTGTPVTNMPTSGTATFAQIGATTPSCAGAGCTGTITVGSSVMLDFGTYTGKLNFGLQNTADGVKLTTAPGGANLSLSGSSFGLSSNNVSLQDDVGSSGVYNSHLYYNGFLAGNGATHAGAAYNVSYSSYNAEGSTTYVAGALAYKRGDLASGPAPGSWATATRTGGVVSGAEYPSTYQLDNIGLLNYSGQGAGQVTSYSESRGGATSVLEGGADGVLAWGHWTGGPTTTSTNGDAGSNTYAAGDPLHWITGTPVTSGTMPTTGMASFSQAGYTTPSCGGASCGTIGISSSMKVDFESYTGMLNFSLTNTGDNVRLTTPSGGAQLGITGSTFAIVDPNNALTDDVGSTGSYNQRLNFQGFFAGAGASHGGASYTASYIGNDADGATTSIAGAIGYSSGGTVAPPPTTNGNWAVAAFGSTNTAQYTPAYYALDSNGALERYGSSDYSYEARSFATAQVDGTDGGVLTWGRWFGGPTNAMLDGDSYKYNYSSSSPLHYITGTPVTNLPTSGTATYSQIGGSMPSCQGPSCGTIGVNSSFSLDFYSLQGKLNFAMTNSADGVGLTTAAGGADINLNINSGHLLYSNNNVPLSDTGTTSTNGTGILAWQGFLAGDGASHAGAAYNVNYTASNAEGVATTVAGTAAYSRGPVTPTVPGGNWVTAATFQIPNTSDNTSATTGYTLNNGTPAGVTGFGSDSNYSYVYAQQNGSATVIADGNDGVMAWGRWTGGPTTKGNNYGSEYMHYVAGLPATNMPTSGSASYTSTAGTPISCSGVGCGGGAFTAISGIQVTFGANPTGNFNLTLTNSNSSIAASSALAMNGPNFNAYIGNLTSANGTIDGKAISGGNLSFQGFLAGDMATRAGAVFQGGISNASGGTNLAGGLVYTKTGP